MRCPRSKLISAYLDQELRFGEKTAFEAHVQGCIKCSHTLEEMRSLRAAFATAAHHPAPYGFATRVTARTAALEAPSPYPLPSGERVKVRGWFVPFSIRFAEAAILLIVITVGILAGRAMTNNSPVSITSNIASSLSLDLFDATPPGSLGGAYIAMTEARNEK